MSYEVYSIQSLREKRRQGTFEAQVPFVVNGKEFSVTKKIVNGEMETFALMKPVGEMLTASSLEQFKELVQKVVLDVEIGRETVPLLYKPIYETMENRDMPQLIDAKWALHGTVIFTEHMEGEEVKFGRLAAEYGPVARILTYAAGFEYTKEMKEFNNSFSLEVLNRAFGEAYNALLNHLHLGPILSYDYKASNKTGYQGEAGEDAWRGLWKTLTKALADTRVAKRPATVLLASSTDAPNIEMALKGGYQVNGTVYPAIGGISSVIFYDGWSVKVGKKTYEYPGVTPGTAYLIRPKRGFKELVKRDLQIEATQGDLSRLIESQIVGYAFRGSYAALDENVQEVAITGQ